MVGIYQYLNFKGGCSWADSMTIIFTQSEAFWENVIVSEGAVIQETSAPDANGMIKKHFNAKGGSGNTDFVAFLIFQTDELNGETILWETVEFQPCQSDCAKLRENWVISPSLPGAGNCTADDKLISTEDVVPAVQEEPVKDEAEDPDDSDEDNEPDDLPDGMEPFVDEPDTKRWEWESDSGASSLASAVAVATCLILQY